MTTNDGNGAACSPSPKGGIGMRVYRVWYEPYLYPGESDFIDVTASTIEEAIEFARTIGHAEDAYPID